MRDRHRVLLVCTHPVQYAAPILQRMAVHPKLDTKVAYRSLQGAQPGMDAEFGARGPARRSDSLDWLPLCKFLGCADSGEVPPVLFDTDAVELRARDGRGWKSVAKRCFWQHYFRWRT